MPELLHNYQFQRIRSEYSEAWERLYLDKAVESKWRKAGHPLALLFSMRYLNYELRLGPVEFIPNAYFAKPLPIRCPKTKQVLMEVPKDSVIFEVHLASDAVKRHGEAMLVFHEAREAIEQFQAALYAGCSEVRHAGLSYSIFEDEQWHGRPAFLLAGPSHLARLFKTYFHCPLWDCTSLPEYVLNPYIAGQQKLVQMSRGQREVMVEDQTCTLIPTDHLLPSPTRRQRA